MLNGIPSSSAPRLILTISTLAAQQQAGGRGRGGGRSGAARAPAPPADGASVYLNNCASCHNNDDPRIPSAATLRQRTPEAVLDALTTGVMRAQGAELTEAQRRAVAEYVTGEGVHRRQRQPRQVHDDARVHAGSGTGVERLGRGHHELALSAGGAGGHHARSRRRS